ncbi:MAG: GspE/PulE family protein [Candidatus Anstonellales archaeon]
MDSLITIIDELRKERGRGNDSLLYKLTEYDEIMDYARVIGIDMNDIERKVREISGLYLADLDNINIDDKLRNKFKLELLYKKGYLLVSENEGVLDVVTYKLVDGGRKELVEFIGKQGYSIRLSFCFECLLNKWLYETGQIYKFIDVKDIDVNDFVDNVIKIGIANRASDIHIEPQKRTIRVRYRVDGELTSLIEIEKDLDMYSNFISRIKILSNLDIAESRKPQDGSIVDFSYMGKTFDIRVSTVATVLGEKVVMRLLNKNEGLLDFKQLGFEEDEEKVVKSILSNTSGIVLLTGATGSGKSTTLYTMMDYVNREGINVSTIEDPVEKTIDGINQVQVSEYVKQSEILKSFLRQDPDVIVVGEIRDSETAELAVKAAMTGHLVIATIHAKNTQEIPSRLENLGVERYLIANTSVGYLSQRLIRRVCNHCKHKYKPSEEELKWLRDVCKIAGLDIPDELYIGRGCKECNWTGYRGRQALVEVIEVSDEVREKILNKDDFINKYALWVSACKKIIRGDTTISEVMRVLKG